jgi:hypothetical protein
MTEPLKIEEKKREPLRTGDIVRYNDKLYNVKLNGKNVFMRSDAPHFTVKREVAEALPRDWRGEIANTPAPAREKDEKKKKQEVAAVQPEDKVAKLRALLADKLKDDTKLDELVEQACSIFVSGNKVGGVYMIHITEIADKPVVFVENGKETSDYVLIKIGKADNFAERFRQFSFKYTEVFRVDGDTTMEADLKRMIPANWKSYYFGTGSTKHQVLSRLGIPGNNGPTEWRIMTKKTFDAIVAKAPKINSLNWRRELFFDKPLKLDEKALTMHMGVDKPRANSVRLEIL